MFIDCLLSEFPGVNLTLLPPKYVSSCASHLPLERPLGPPVARVVISIIGSFHFCHQMVPVATIKNALCVYVIPLNLHTPEAAPEAVFMVQVEELMLRNLPRACICSLLSCSAPLSSAFPGGCLWKVR